MAIIPLPDTGFRAVRYRLQSPAMVNRSAWTGARQVMSLPGPTRFTLAVEHLPIMGEDRMLAWRAFFATLMGQVQTFRLPMTETEQVPVGVSASVRVGAGAIVNSVQVTVAGATGQIMAAGRVATIAEQPVILTADLVVGENGQGVLSFMPPLRKPAPAGTEIKLHRPTALVALDSDVTEWGVEPGQLYGFSFEASEAF